MALSIDALITRVTASEYYAQALEIAETIGLPVTSWQPGDPTRSLYLFVSEVLGNALESIVVEYIKGGFLGLAETEWLTIAAEDGFGTTRIPSTYAATSVVLTNAGGGNYPYDPGDLVLKNTTTGATYHNTTGGTLAPLSTLTLDVEADDEGTAGNAAAGEIDALVTTFLGVTCTNPTAAIGIDAEEDPDLRARARSAPATTSPTGPKDSYTYVATTPTLSGAPGVTRARLLPAPGDGTVTLVLAGPSGAVSSGDRDAVEAAVIALANPAMVTPIVVSATSFVVPVTATAYVYTTANKTSAELIVIGKAALDTALSRVPIGGDEGSILSQSYLISALLQAYSGHCYKVTMTTPSADIALADTDAVVGGTHTLTIVLVSP